MLGAKMQRQARRALRVGSAALVVCTFASGASSCGPSGSGSAPSSSSSSASAPLAPAVEPRGLVATFVLGDPDRSLASARALLGSRGGLLLSRDSVSRLAVELGMPATTIDLFDGSAPIVGCVTRPDGASPPKDAHASLSFAWSVKDSARLLSLTTFGASPPFTDRLVAGGHVLSPLGRVVPVAIGLFGEHVVVSTDESALTATGAFLDQRARLPVDPKVTFAGEIDAAFVAAALADQTLPGLARVPGAEQAALAAKPLLGLVGGLGKVSVRGTLDGARLSLTARAALPPGHAFLGVGRGARAGAFVVPPGAQVALTYYEGPEARLAAAGSSADFLSLLLSKDDVANISSSLGELGRARGERSTLAFELGPRGPAIYGDLAIGDAQSAEHALSGLVDALDKKSVRSAVRAHGFKLGAKKTVVERVGDVVRIRVARLPDGQDAAAAEPENVDLYFRLAGGRLVVGGGADAISALTHAIGDAAPLDDAIARAPEMLSVALFVDPARLHDPRATPSVALFTADVDPARQELTVALDVDAAALSALLDLGLTR